jgi:hypothetical protein
MNLVVHIPDDLAARLSDGGDVERQALEALVLESFRAGRISTDEVGRVLGLDGLDEIDGFLKAHEIYEPYTLADFEREQQALDRLGL